MTHKRYAAKKTRRKMLPTSSTLSVRDVIALYLRHSKATDKHCRNALAHREGTLARFCTTYGDVLVSDCAPYHLSDWIENNPSWRKVSTRRSNANIVRAAFQWAFEQERIQRNPFRNVRYDQGERRPDMPDHVLERVATLGNKPFERAIWFLRYTGCRLTELCNAKWADVDLTDPEKAVWTIHLHKSRKHTGKAKKVALVPEAVDVLKTVLKGAGLFAPDPASHIFTNTRGTPWTASGLGKQFNRLKEKHHIETPATLHGVRHRFGTAAIAAGAPIKLVSEQLGHASVTITESYYVDLRGEMDSIRAAVRLGIPAK